MHYYALLTSRLGPAYPCRLRLCALEDSVSRHQVFLTARNMVASRRQLSCRNRAHACRATRFALIRLFLDALAILAMKCCHQLLLLDSLRQGPGFPRRPLDQIVSSVQPGIVPAPCTRIACITLKCHLLRACLPDRAAFGIPWPLSQLTQQ